MRTVFTLLLFFSVSFYSAAQQYSIKGYALTDGTEDPLIGANATLYKMGTSIVKGAVTDENGFFEIKSLEAGRYRLVISYIGYESFAKRLKIEDKDIDMDKLYIKEESINIEGVEITEKAPPAVVKGDTMQYNASAFKTLKDADAEDLIAKMPGVVIENGKVQAQGEDVKKVTVDGREFFGNDPNAALRNLPSEVIDKIQVFDEKSDQAQFTGFDDGETSKTINIVTKPNMRTGQFGKVYGGYGTDERYRTGGNISFFDGNRRISIIGQSNNVNEQNFSTEDLLGVVGSSGRRGRGGFRSGGSGRGGGGSGSGRRGRGGGGASIRDFMTTQQDGISTTHAVGINYSDKWGEKMDVSGSYFFNMNENTAIEELTQEYVNPEDLSDFYFERSSALSDNNNHRIQMKLEYKIDESNSIIMRPRLSFQNNESDQLTSGETWLAGMLDNQTNNDYASNTDGYNFSNSLLFRHRFKKPKRTFSISLTQGLNSKKGDNGLYSLDEYFDPYDVDTLLQFTDIDQSGWNVGSNVSWTEPAGENGMLLLNYGLRYQKDNSDKTTVDEDPLDPVIQTINPSLSSVFDNNTTTHRIGTGYQWRKDKLMLMARATFQHTDLDADQTYPIEGLVEKSYNSILPFLMLRYQISRERNLRFFYRSSTQNPEITDLQSVVDNSNPLQLTTGNPDLNQSTQHSIYTRFSWSNVEKATVFYGLLRFSFANDYIGESIYLDGRGVALYDELNVNREAQLTRPVNLDGYISTGSFFTYGFPLSSIKSKLNFNISGNYSKIPGLINEEKNEATNTTAGIGVVLTSNISDRLDFTISSRSNLGNVTNSSIEDENNDYLNQVFGFKLDAILWKGIVLRSNFNYQFYRGYGDSFNEDFTLWNVSIGKKIFPNERGEISISFYDILDQNQAITRTVNSTYIEDAKTNVLEQYIMLNFKYDLRHFRKGN